MGQLVEWRGWALITLGFPHKGIKMRAFCSRMYATLEVFHTDESAQDLIEYALISAILALGAVVSMNSLANEVNTAFSHVHSKFHKHVGKHLGWDK